MGIGTHDEAQRVYIPELRPRLRYDPTGFKVDVVLSGSLTRPSPAGITLPLKIVG